MAAQARSLMHRALGTLARIPRCNLARHSAGIVPARRAFTSSAPWSGWSSTPPNNADGFDDFALGADEQNRVFVVRGSAERTLILSAPMLDPMALMAGTPAPFAAGDIDGNGFTDCDDNNCANNDAACGNNFPEE